MTPGYKTTEFYLSLLVSLLGAFVGSGLVVEGHWALQAAGFLMTVLASLGYTATRASVKKAELVANSLSLPPLEE